MSVRITQGTTNRSYLKNLNNAQHSMNLSMEKIDTGRAFTKVSENVPGGVKAIGIRERLYHNEQIQDNVNTAIEQLNVAETSIMQINDICSTVQAEMFKALNTPTLEAGKETFDSFLEGAKDELLRLANSKYNNKYAMGGLGVAETPYKADENGYLMFNGTHMFNIAKGSNMAADFPGTDKANEEIKSSYHVINPAEDENDSFKVYDIEENVDYTAGKLKYSGESYVDVGLDISVSKDGVHPKTAFKVSVDGIGILGYGASNVETDDGKQYEISNNLYDMMTQMQEAIRNADIDKLSAITGHFKEQTEEVITGVSELGVRSKYLETTLTRLENENTSLQKMQLDTEGIDDATEITNYMSYKNSWNLILQFGGNVIPKSLMDYVG